MSWLAWLWAFVTGVFFVGAGIIFIAPPFSKREGAGCGVAALGLLLMFAMLFVTIAVDPGY